MSKREFSVIVNRPVEEVFAFASDPNKLVQWGEGIQEVRVTSDGPVDIGSTFIVKNKMGGRIQEFKNEVIAYEPGHKFGFRSGGGAFGYYTSERTFEENNGKTIIIEAIEAEGPSGFLKIFMPFILGFIKKSHHNSMNRLKEILESQGKVPERDTQVL